MVCDPQRVGAFTDRWMMGNSVAVLYIYYGHYNYKTFMESYKFYDSGYPHDLFTLLPGEGMNVGAFLDAAAKLPHEFICCCTAYTEFLTDDWLEKMMKVAERPGVGAVDVMGSYESRSQWGYDGAAAEGFPAFPNPHLRVVCLLIRRELLLGFGFRPMRSKLDTLVFESGNTGLPACLKEIGLQQVVVGADGTAYPEEMWSVSKTFRLGDQSNLIAHDKHSRAFAAMNPEMRAWHTKIAYGDNTNV